MLTVKNVTDTLKFFSPGIKTPQNRLEVLRTASNFPGYNEEAGFSFGSTTVRYTVNMYLIDETHSGLSHGLGTFT